jgi:hypothetical protein
VRAATTCASFSRAEYNTSEEIFKKVQELLVEAYDMAVRKRARTKPADEA